MKSKLENRQAGLMEGSEIKSIIVLISFLLVSSCGSEKPSANSDTNVTFLGSCLRIKSTNEKTSMCTEHWSDDPVWQSRIEEGCGDEAGEIWRAKLDCSNDISNAIAKCDAPNTAMGHVIDYYFEEGGGINFATQYCASARNGTLHTL